MSMHKHAGKILRCSRRPTQTGSVWIGDDLLETTFRNFVRQRGCTRSVGSAPGPLEARKRTAKRKIAYQSVEPGVFGFGRGVLRNWEEARTSDETEHDYGRPETIISNSAPPQGWSLASWLQSATRRASKEPRAAALESSPREESRLSYQDLLHQVGQYTRLTDLRDGLMRTSFSGEVSSQEVFMQILQTARSTEFIFEYLEDRLLNPPESGNLFLFLGARSAQQYHSLREENLEFDKIASWIQMQLSLGNFAIQELEVFSQAVDQIHISENKASQVLKLVEAFVQGVDACPVLGFQDIKLTTVKRFLRACLKLPVHSEAQALLQRFIGLLPPSQVEQLCGLLSRSLFLRLTETSSGAGGTLTSGIAANSRAGDMLSLFSRVLPQALLPKVVFSVSRQVVDKLASSSLQASWWDMLGRNGLLLLFVQAAPGQSILNTFSECRSIFGSIFTQHISQLEFAQCILQHWCSASSQKTLLGQRLLLEKNPNQCLPLLVQHAAANENNWDTFIGRLLDVLGSVGMTKAAINIVSKAKKFGYAVPQAALEIAVSRFLLINSDFARDLVLRNQFALMEDYPEVAESYILATHLDPAEIWAWLNRKRAKYRDNKSTGGESAHEALNPPENEQVNWEKVLTGRILESVTGVTEKEPNRTRAILLEKMAIAFAIRQKLTTQPLFFDVFRCLKIHITEQLGPVRPLMIRALVQTGLIEALQHGRFVHRNRADHILALASNVEGEAAISAIEAPVNVWSERNRLKILNSESMNVNVGVSYGDRR